METNNNAFDIAELILKQQQHELTAQEKEKLEQWINASNRNRALYTSLLQEQQAIQDEIEFLAGVDVQNAWQKVARATGQQQEAKVIPMWQRPALWLNIAAVLVMVVLAAGFYQYKFAGNDQLAAGPGAADSTQAAYALTDKAVLQLYDGSTIVLDSLHTGNIGELNGVKVISDDGVIRIDASAAASDAAPDNAMLAYNTITTPRGMHYQVVLPDGSKVWLNSVSSLKFPAAFSGAARRVELTGEAYFEVVKDQKQFIVTAGDVDVAVLGTSFNVSAYEADQDIATTLVTGRVQLSGGAGNGLTDLTPGKRAVYTKASGKMVVSQVDTELYTIWKEGKFYFEDEELETIITKLSRWYTIDVEFSDQTSRKKTFTGVAFKNRPIEHLLSMISQTTDVTFEEKGGKLLIKKK